MADMIDVNAPLYGGVNVLTGYLPFRGLELPDSIFEREEMREEDWTTLEKIRRYVREDCKISDPITVMVEEALSGIIYQCGNYGKDVWCIHGKTKGYA